jgi:hypothetical protein
MQPEGFPMLTSIDLSAVHCTDLMSPRHTGGVNFALGLPSSKLPTFSEGRYPARQINREADKAIMLSHLRGKFSIAWIPAFAGMTKPQIFVVFTPILETTISPEFFTPSTTINN